ncbi:MAG: hypothetical protein CMP57_05070 [Flavobacteriales bacterium]|nr:hypothetical protein [Flavobacteriales bacterium]|tara:strand:+ start:471 stop:1256 length:786 start_codon:yes stop_codon:yes gene_type:complete
MYFDRGDKVSFINEVLQGIVIDHLGEGLVIVECQGIEMKVSTNEIIKINHIPKLRGKNIFPIKKSIKKIDQLPYLEVDSIKSTLFIEGDLVSFMSDNSKGKIIAKLNDFMYNVEIEPGLSIPVNRLEIEKIWQTDSNFNKKEIERKIKNDLYKAKPILSKKKKVEDIYFNHYEIDLHIENLVDSWSHLSNFEIVLVQVSAFKKRLYQAFNDNENQLIVIHGVGKGVLKDKIAEVVNILPNVSMHTADMKIYGMGASQIKIH